MDPHHSEAAKCIVCAQAGPTKLSLLIEFDILQKRGVFLVFFLQCIECECKESIEGMRLF